MVNVTKCLFLALVLTEVTLTRVGLGAIPVCMVQLKHVHLWDTLNLMESKLQVLNYLVT